MKLMLSNFASNTSFANKIPYINLIISALQGFTPSRLETDWMSSLTRALKEAGKIIAGDGELEKLLDYSLKALSDASGIAGYNIYRDGRAFIEMLND
jgi:hypothetical protein